MTDVNTIIEVIRERERQAKKLEDKMIYSIVADTVESLWKTVLEQENTIDDLKTEIKNRDNKIQAVMNENTAITREIDVIKEHYEQSKTNKRSRQAQRDP